MAHLYLQVLLLKVSELWDVAFVVCTKAYTTVQTDKAFFIIIFEFEPRHANRCLRACVDSEGPDQTARICADSEGPDQPAHPRNLIRAFTVR